MTCNDYKHVTVYENLLGIIPIKTNITKSIGSSGGEAAGGTAPLCPREPSFICCLDTVFPMIPLLTVAALNHRGRFDQWHSTYAVDGNPFTAFDFLRLPTFFFDWEHCKLLLL